MSHSDKDIYWLHGEIHTPPFTQAARVEAGYLLRLLQQGEKLSMPYSRPMPAIGRNCHELRILDGRMTWRIVYHVDCDAIIILDVFPKKTEQTPRHVVKNCKRRLKQYRNT